MCRPPLKLLVVVGLLAVPRMVAAQSAIAGVVRDTTGAVLPGVTVEVTSPALIEKVRTATTDQAGQYRVVDLRPGSYSVVFTLAGFNSIRREGIVLEANFTAPVNAELRVGAITETVTVSGETPVVDVQNTMRREVVTRELLDTLPTGRDFQTIGNVLPGVTMGRFDVGGSSTAQSGTLVAFGSRGADFQLKIDGMHANNSFGEGWFNGIYHNEAAFQEMAYTVSGGNAENQAAGVSVNMIPRTGGNAYSYELLSTYANDSFQGENIDDALRAQGIQPDGRRPAKAVGRQRQRRRADQARPPVVLRVGQELGLHGKRPQRLLAPGRSPGGPGQRGAGNRPDHAGVLRRARHDPAGADPPDRQLQLRAAVAATLRDREPRRHAGIVRAVSEQSLRDAGQDDLDVDQPPAVRGGVLAHLVVGAAGGAGPDPPGHLFRARSRSARRAPTTATSASAT